MKKRFLLLFVLCLLILPLTGCTKYVKDKKGRVVKEPTTGQTLASNILCQPTNKEVIRTYEKNKVNIKKLPKCSNFTMTSGKYHGLWESLFIKPLSFLIIKAGEFLGNYGWAIVFVTLLIRLVIFPISKKSALQADNMKLAQKDMQKLEDKYRNRDSQQDQMLKAQEMMSIYKKYDINPMSGCLFAFIQMPLFFAFLECLNRLPIVFEGKFLGFNLGMSPFVKLFGDSLNFNNFISSFSNGNIIYIILPILVCLSTYFSFKLNSGMGGGSSEQQQQMKTMMNIMLVFITFTSFTMPVSIIIYWITGTLFTIIQAELIRRMKDGSRDSKKRIKK